MYKIISQKLSTQQKCILTSHMFRSHMDHHQAVQYTKYDSVACENTFLSCRQFLANYFINL
jgi:hypothetical protein